MSQIFTPDDVQEAFLAAPPLIDQQILDLTIKHPSWMRDMWELAPWPKGQGSVIEQLIFRGSLPEVERGFDKWKRVSNVSGCDPCEPPDCSYNTTTFGGHGFDRVLTGRMDRDFRSPAYCINEIETTANFMEVFAKIVENIYRQTDFFKEENIGHNYLTSLAKKFVVDSEGAKINTGNIYVYPNTGDVRLSTLNISMLEFFYENLRRIPDAIPYDVVDGSPIYALEASHQLLARMYRDDANLRQDVRFSGMANDLLTKYNFMSTIRGMFIAAPILYPRRFNIVAGEPVEVLPFVNGIPAEVGSYSYLSPLYEAATHEEVTIHGKYPFKVFAFDTGTTLGANTSFGPEVSFMQNWIWINPQTDTDPLRRQGYFMTTAKIGLSRQFSEGIYSILVERPSVRLMATYTPNPEGPVEPETFDNVIPASSCPCPLVIDITANPLVPGNFFITFATAITGVATEAITLEMDTGVTIAGVIDAVSADGKIAEVDFAEATLDVSICSQIIGISCAENRQCSATVQSTNDCRSGVTDVINVVLSNAIRAGVGDTITAWFGDCTTADMNIVAVNADGSYDLEYGTGFGPSNDPDGSVATDQLTDFVCDRGGISKVCVPPETDATCPACEFSLVPCEESST